jgi:hypothetical protein
MSHTDGIPPQSEVETANRLGSIAAVVGLVAFTVGRAA